MTLKGSEKQIAWAQDIINAMIEVLDRDIAINQEAAAKRIAKGKKPGYSQMMLDWNLATKEAILTANEVDAGRVIEKAKDIPKTKDIEGISIDVESIWNAITAKRI